MPFAITMVGETYGRLTVLRKDKRACLCRCTCGAELIVRMDKLRSGNTRSCGCLRDELWAARTEEEKRLGLVWSNIKQRCMNPANPAYPRYGGRGITMDPRWVESSSAFIADMGPTYWKGATIERKDNDKGYTPENCVWADWHQQAANRGNTVRFPDGISVTAWARQQGLAPDKAVRKSKQGALTQEEVLAGWGRRKQYTPKVSGTFPNGATFHGVARARGIPVTLLAEAYCHLLFETGEPPTQSATVEHAQALA